MAEKYVEMVSPELSCSPPVSGKLGFDWPQGTYAWRIASTPSLPFLNSPGLTSIPTFSSFASKCATVFFVRASSQTISRQSGLPVLRDHATALSRWLVMPVGARRPKAHPHQEKPRFVVRYEISVPHMGRTWVTHR